MFDGLVGRFTENTINESGLWSWINLSCQEIRIWNHQFEKHFVKNYEINGVSNETKAYDNISKVKGLEWLKDESRKLFDPLYGWGMSGQNEPPHTPP